MSAAACERLSDRTYRQACAETDPFSGLNVPAGQTLHFGDARASWYVPSLQGLHCSWPYLFWKVPRGHSWHTADFALAAKLPGRHTLHCAAPAAGICTQHTGTVGLSAMGRVCVCQHVYFLMYLMLCANWDHAVCHQIYPAARELPKSTLAGQPQQ